MRLLRVFILGTLAFLAAGILAGGCGKKGPPLPPLKTGSILAAPVDLTFDLTQNRVVLRWSLGSGSTEEPSPQAVEVFLAVKGPADCQGCPLVFRSMGIVPLPDMAYEQDLFPGSRYYFRVQALGPERMKSEYSQTVMVDLSDAAG